MARINKTSTIAFNDLLQEMNLCEILISPLTFELLGYSLKNLPDTICLLNELGEINYEDNLISEKICWIFQIFNHKYSWIRGTTSEIMSKN